jgi:hypothetical protein
VNISVDVIVDDYHLHIPGSNQGRQRMPTMPTIPDLPPAIARRILGMLCTSLPRLVPDTAGATRQEAATAGVAALYPVDAFEAQFRRLDRVNGTKPSLRAPDVPTRDGRGLMPSLPQDAVSLKGQ